MSALRRPLRRALDRVETDLAVDPALRYLLALSVVTCGFGVWFRVPNFAGPDEYSRLIQPMKVAGRVGADPGLDSAVAAVTDGRTLGATFYLYGAVLVPVFLAVVASGQLGEFLALGSIRSRWALWHATPTWFWTATVLLGRLVNVALGVGTVYLTYRLGVELRDRSAGRLAALFLALSVGFVSQTHLVGEDVPMLFCLLASVLLARRYAAGGDRRVFFAGALASGAAIAFKLSGGVAAVVLGVAHLDRARRTGDPLAELVRLPVLLGGLAVGLLTVYLGIPSVLVGGPAELLARATGSIASKTSRAGGLEAPIWYWFLRQYVRGLGVPLTLAAAGATALAVGRVLVRRRSPSPLGVLLATSVLVFLLVYSRWEFVRLRHLVPTFPALLAVLGCEVSRLREATDRRRALRFAVGLLVVTSGAAVATAEYEYVSDPRDRATAYLDANMDRNDAVEVYENSVADVGVPHGTTVSHYPYRENRATDTASLVLNETAYTEWMLAMPERSPEYIQLTAAELAYVSPLSPRSELYPQRRRFVRDLRRGEYGYDRVASFGEPDRPDSLREDLVRAALDPEIPGRERYVAIYRRSRPSASGSPEDSVSRNDERARLSRTTCPRRDSRTAGE